MAYRWRVVDAGANLVAFRRVDGTFLGSVEVVINEVAINKAKSSGAFGFPRVWLRILLPRRPQRRLVVKAYGVMAFAAGIPVRAGDVYVSVVGLSGATVDQDEICARAGFGAAPA